MKSIILSINIFLLAISFANAQNAISDSDIIGTWKGSSTCQIKNSGCHDEIVVYYISKGQSSDSFSISASRITNGKEVGMGVLGFALDRKKNQLVSDSQYGLWTLNCKGKDIDGTLLESGKLFRVVKLKKQ